MKNERGFSLIELLIVVAIIGIIAAIAIPNFTTSRMAANEASAISSLRTICTAQLTYAATTGNGLFTQGLGELATARLIDEALGSTQKSGYNFAMTAGGDVNDPFFTVTATPASENTGIRIFFVDQTGVIRVGTDNTAPVLGSGT